VLNVFADRSRQHCRRATAELFVHYTEHGQHRINELSGEVSIGGGQAGEHATLPTGVCRSERIE
jgi:hypothetical protein